jgi:hypothetical protein
MKQDVPFFIVLSEFREVRQIASLFLFGMTTILQFFIFQLHIPAYSHQYADNATEKFYNNQLS